MILFMLIGPTTYKQHGIAINWQQYNRARKWLDNNYNNGVILTHNGYLFVLLNIQIHQVLLL